MKISVIIPVYNEQETITSCLDALLQQDYPKEDYEIILVDDGSQDQSVLLAAPYPLRLLQLTHNQGRIIARKKGAEAAQYEHLLFLDGRVLAAPDLLTNISRINYQPLMAGSLGEDKYRSGFDTFFYLIRRKIYAPYYPQEQWGEELWIDQQNFNAVPKGTTCFFCSKALFLSALPEEQGSMVNDDTRLLHTIVQQKKILRHRALKVTYVQRTGWLQVLRHIYERGPRFADYYLRKSSRYSIWWQGAVLSAGLFLYAVWYYPEAIKSLVALCLLLLLTVCWFLGENNKDRLLVLCYTPLIVTTFFVGVIKGKLYQIFARS